MIEFFPGSTWIFGDSYGIVHHNGWSGYLEERLDLGNFLNKCVGGSSVPDAYFELMRALKLDSITSKDRVIWVVSEKFRVFRNNHESVRNRVWGDHDSIILNSLLYTACLRDAIAELEQRNIKTLIIWAFPSNWPGDSNLFQGHVGIASWSDEFKKINPDDYGYFDAVDHVDQIRPALYHFSIKEHPSVVMSKDPRPNHMEDQALHRKLTDTVASWIIGQWHGVRDLRTDDAVPAKTLKCTYSINEKMSDVIDRTKAGPAYPAAGYNQFATEFSSQNRAPAKSFQPPEVLREFKLKKWKPKKKT